LPSGGSLVLSILQGRIQDFGGGGVLDIFPNHDRIGFQKIEGTPLDTSLVINISMFADRVNSIKFAK